MSVLIGKTRIRTFSNVYENGIYINTKGICPCTNHLQNLENNWNWRDPNIPDKFHINVPSALVRVHLYEYVGLFCNLRIQCIWKSCSWRFLFLPSHCCHSSDKCSGSWWRRTVLAAQSMLQSMNYNKRLKAGCCSVYFSDFKALGMMYNHWYTCNVHVDEDPYQSLFCDYDFQIGIFPRIQER